MKWPLTFYVDTLPNNSAGCANGPVIRILKSYKSDTGLYQHELLHVKQWFCTLTLHSLLYLAFPSYRKWAETQAYRKQLDYSSNKREDTKLFASFICNHYNLPNLDPLVIEQNLKSGC